MKNPFILHSALVAIGLILLSQSIPAQPTSSLVYPGADGKLLYNFYANESQTSEGNKMIDFSQAGYKGGGVAIPWVPVVRTLNPDPGGGDDYARIQAAINEIAAMPLSAAGFRGTLLLKAGSYRVSSRVNINTSGIIIRGEGQGTDGTVVTFTSRNIYGVDSYAILFYFSGSSGWTKVANTETPITDTVVPSGASVLTVGSTAGLSVGTRIMVRRTPNQAWIDLLQMGQWGWTPAEYEVEAPRVVTAINGNTITLNAPVTHAIESQYGGGRIYRYTFNGAIRQSGIERIRLESVFASATDENHGWEAVRFRQAEDCWARQVTARHFAYACVNAWVHAKNITVEDCAMLDPKSLIDGGRRYSFVVDRAAFVLVQRCYTRGGRHDYVSQARTLGPSAFVDSLAETTYSDTGPHHRYTEALLFDNVKAGQIFVQNRKSSGSGHGWSGAQTVFWNCVANTLICDAPKAAMNFAIGCTGSKNQGQAAPEEAFGIWESLNTPVTPRSLYYKQLEDRLGTAAMLTVTTQNQRNGAIFTGLSSWQGNSTAPGSPAWQPVQVEAFAEASALIGISHPIHATILNPLPANYPTTASWTQVSGPTPAVFANSSAASTSVVFPAAGTYVIRFSASQTDSAAAATYSTSDTVTINADFSWDAGGVNNQWSTLENWHDDADPGGDDVAFGAIGALTTGVTNRVSASKSIRSLSFNFESATHQHTTEIATGQTLAVAGSFSVLTSTAPAVPTNVSITGSTGSLDVTGSSFLLANQTASTTSSTTSVDMSALGTLTANLTGTGSIFRLGGGGASGVTTGNAVTLRLATNSTITASTVGVSDNSNFSTVQKMLLGSGTNMINTNALRVGSSSGGRGAGEISFNTVTGTLLLRSLDGVAATTNLNMVNASANTSNNLTSVVNLNGHNVDAKITNLTMARRTGTANTASGFASQATLSFNQGILEVGPVIMGANVNASLIGKIEATINIGGGTASFGAISMADNSAGNTTKTITAALNLTGGATTVTGNIVKPGSTNATATVALKGGTLDMTAGNIGSLSNPVTLILESGSLQNVAQINGGGAITKTSAGILTLSGVNTFTGNVSILEGTLSATTSSFADTSALSIGSPGGPAAVLHLPNAGNDLVTFLSINGVTQPAGKVYGNASSVLPVIATPAITGPGTITVAGGPVTPYTAWASVFLPVNDVSDPNADNDNDGLSNHQEFAFGLNPVNGSSVNPILVPLDKANATFTYQRRAGTGLTYRVLTSTSLAANGWTEDNAATQSQIATPSGSNETVVVTLTGSPLSAPRLFIRVAAE
jgi:autotransporter-associated beta strand protein